MKDRREDSADFGHDVELEEDDIEDEVVPDEIPEDEEPIDDSPDGEPDGDEDDNDDGEPEKPELKKRDKAQTRINQLQRERYRAIHQAEKAAAEAEAWRQKYEMASQMSTRFYDADVNSRLQKAHEDQVKAIESGDAQAQADSIKEIAAVTAELQDLNKSKYQEQYRQTMMPQQNQEQQYQQIVPDREVLNEWYQDNHEWINPSSRSFDEDLARHIKTVDEQISQGLIEKGLAGAIGSSDYFNELDKHKEDFLANRNKGQNQRRDLNMRQPRGGASPVRSANPTQHRSSRQEYKLSPEEREMAKIVGVEEDKFVKEKIKFMREEAMKGGRR